MNIKNNFLEGIVKIVLNDKAASSNNKMVYGYYPKLLKQYGIFLLSLIYNTPVDHQQGRGWYIICEMVEIIQMNKYHVM